MRIRATRLVLSLVLASAALLALAPAAAEAAFVKFGSFGSAQLANPIGVAVDQSSHDIFVGNLLFSGNDKFDSSGNLLSPPSPFSDPNGSGVYSGTAVNPTNGDVYVVDAGNQQVDTFDPNSGALLSSFSVPGSANFGGSFTIVQIASDAAGNVYVPNAPNNEVQEYSPAGALLNTFTGSGATALSAPTGVAVDASGNVWVADSGNGRVEEFDPTGATVLDTIASAGVQALALDSAGDVFALVLNGADPCGSMSSPCHHVVEYSAAGTQLDDFGAGTIGTSAIDPSIIDTLAIDNTTGKAYVTDGGSNVVWVFGPPQPPAIDSTYATGVTADGASLGAQINPGGADTTYHFQYGTGDCSANPCASVPVADADIGSGVSDVTVSDHVQGLSAGTTYHYRVVATNSVAPTDGPDRTFTTQSSAGAGPDTCPNAAFRAQQSAAFLLDCRAYEQVSPANKGDGTLAFVPPGIYQTDVNQASVTGDGLAYEDFLPFPGSTTGFAQSMLASRGANGWSSQDLTPPQATNPMLDALGPQMDLYAPDLSKAVFADGGSENGVSQDDPPLVSGEPANNQNLFLRDNSSGSYRLVNVTPAGATPEPAIFEGATVDLSHVIFHSTAQLTPGANAPGSGKFNLYDWSNGTVSLVNQVPVPPATSCGSGGPSCQVSPAEVGMLGYGFAHQPGTLSAVSNDGSKLFFTSPPIGASTNTVQQLYVRENGTRTVQYSASRKTNGSGPGGTDPNGPRNVSYWTASADGSKVFFTSCEQLTNDSTANSTGEITNTGCTSGGSSGQDLYQFDSATGVLSDLTVDHADPVGADVQGVLGASADGSYVYFVANGVLASGTSPGNCIDFYGGTANIPPADRCNLYVEHDGTTTFIARLSDLRDGSDWTGAFTARVTPDGTHLAFDSALPLTGHDSTPASPGDCADSNQPGLGCHEVFLYNATSRQLVCASCNPTGARPIGDATLPQENIPVAAGSVFPRLLANLTADGTRLFFDSGDALVPGAVNGLQNVYEYEQDGSGSCGTAGGCIHLISSGTSGVPSTFVDASPSGHDVFFETGSQLVGQDNDTKYDIYDARVGGGFPFTPASSQPCSGEACRPAPSGSPPDQTMGSSSFSGPGNPTATRQQSGRAKKCKKRKKHHKRKCKKSRKSTARAAGTTRGAGR